MTHDDARDGGQLGQSPDERPASPVAAPSALRREQARSLWLHRHVADALLLDPDGVLGLAGRNLDQLEQVHAAHAVLVGADPSRSELRQSSPFAGVLEPEVRHQVLRAFADDGRARASLNRSVVR